MDRKRFDFEPIVDAPVCKGTKGGLVSALYGERRVRTVSLLGLTQIMNFPRSPRLLLVSFVSSLLVLATCSAWSKSADTRRTVTGDCNGGADVTIKDDSWGANDSFRCAAEGTLIFGGNIEIREGAEVNLSGGTVRLVPPVTIASKALVRIDTAMTRSTDDDDEDGLPNGYEIEHGLDHTDPTDAVLDADGDGVNNLGEYQDGTNPSDGSDFYFPSPELMAEIGDERITYLWDSPVGFAAEDFATLYISEEPINGDLESFGEHASGRTINDATSPYPDTGLVIGTTYYGHLALTNVTQSGDARTTLSPQLTTLLTFPPLPLNDTGQTWGGDYSSGNNGVCASNIAAPQDCHHGRDALAIAGQLPKEGGGIAAFDFTKLDGNGAPLDEDSPSWSCVKDNNTGLVWEIKASAGNGIIGDEGLHDADDRFNWYDTNPATNGGADGFADDDGAICHGYQSGVSSTFCNTQAFASRVNQQRYCGFDDWRVPSREELRSIVDYGHYDPAIDTDFFPDSQSVVFWSSSADVYDSGYAWYVYFKDGFDYYGYRDYYDAVRLVRGGP